ncbi:MAG: hypothetical protein WC282_00495 [Bacilli bacterium]|jgi:hypothetical protein
MTLKRKIKQFLIHKILKSNNRKHPFDIDEADSFRLSDESDINCTDSHYFSSHASDGTSFFFRLAKRGDKTTELWFCLKTRDGRIFVNPEQLVSSDSCPAHIKSLEIGQKMEIEYTGNVALATIQNDHFACLSQNRLSVNALVTFNATMPPFDFTTGLDPLYVAEALAMEKWNKVFWANLRKNRQVHYEQAGTISLDVIIGDEKFEYTLPGMRDHSYGYRDWDYMNRHIWLMAIFDDGEILNLNMVNYPHMHNLRTGYRSSKGKHTPTRAISNLSLLGKDGKIPSQIKLELTSLDGKSEVLTASRDFIVDFPFDNGKYHIFEGVGAFSIGQRKARGIIEFGYHQDGGRWGKEDI